MADSFEGQIQALEQTLGTAEKGAVAAASRLRGLRRRVSDGDIAQVATLLDQITGQVEQLGEAVQAVRAALGHDVTAALTDGSWVAELLAEARAQGLVVTERDGRLTAFPVLLRLLPQQAAVRVGSRIERRLRPAVLVRELRKRQASAGFNAARTLERLFGAYAHAARHVVPGWRANTPGDGPVVTLNELYELLTLGGADISREAFAVDLLLIDRTPDQRTRLGHRFTLPASTGSKGANRIGVYDEQGVEHVYFGIRFSLDATQGGGGGNRA